MDIATCKVYLPDADAKNYCALFERYMTKCGASVTTKSAIAQSIDALNGASATALTEQQSSKKKQKSVLGVPQDVSTITQSTTPSSKDYIQLTIDGGSGPNSENKLSMAIADFIHGCGLAFSVSEHPKFRKVITFAKAVGHNYKIPSRRWVATDLLQINYDSMCIRWSGKCPKSRENVTSTLPAYCCNSWC
jgi:hypothetical protein